MFRIDKKFRRYWKNYVFQSVFAAFAIFIVLLFFNIQKRPIIIASIGSSVFIVFALPKNITAKPRRVIGGHLTGLFCGSLSVLIPHSSLLSSLFVYSFAVGASIFLMVITDTEHPPASGTALGIAVAGPSLHTTIAVIAGVVTLSLLHHFFNPYIRDLA